MGKMRWYEAIVAFVVVSLVISNCFVLIKFALLKEEMPNGVSNFMSITIPLIFALLERFFQMIQNLITSKEDENV